MNYEELEHFIRKKMRMTHIYQPIIIMMLLKSKDSTASIDAIARRLLNNDESQLEYYKKVGKRWPRQTLKKHGVVDYDDDVYTLLLDKKITENQKTDLLELCNEKLKYFIDKNPKIMRFRELDKLSVSGSVRYDILSRSKGVCVACGARSTQAMLHVDHIKPRSLGGKTEPSNLQALCYKCNTQKRNRDNLDFLKWHTRLKESRKSSCLLCSEEGDVLSNGMAHFLHPRKPDVKMHMVVAPTRHVRSFIDLIPAERQLCLNLVDQAIIHIKGKSSTEFDVTGFDRSSDHFCIDIIPKPQKHKAHNSSRLNMKTIVNKKKARQAKS
ncbi:MAG: HNH endonuclease [Nitrosopumilus sp. H8]|nr:MAG: HNH endonuclease [Nitrosopumilus sp. H8]